MKLHFLGANRQVTGSRYCLEVAGKRVMIDCGMFQERKFQPRNWDPSPIPPASIDAMLLTHVHIDHCGLIPKLVKDGFRGADLCDGAVGGAGRYHAPRRGGDSGRRHRLQAEAAPAGGAEEPVSLSAAVHRARCRSVRCRCFGRANTASRFR